MKLTFLGTSHGVPEKDRKCSCIMLETENGVYFIDMGMSAIEELRKREIPIEAVKAVFITHQHGDHTNGVIPFYDLCNWYFKDADPLIIMPEKSSIDAMKQWVFSNTQTPDRGIRTQVTCAGEIYNDGFAKVTAIPTKHTDKSFALVFEAEGKKLLFTGDLKRPEIDFPPVDSVDKLDVLVSEAAHFSPLEYVPFLEKIQTERFFVSHISPRWHADLDELVCSTAAEAVIDNQEILL